MVLLDTPPATDLLLLSDIANKVLGNNNKIDSTLAIIFHKLQRNLNTQTAVTLIYKNACRLLQVNPITTAAGCRGRMAGTYKKNRLKNSLVGDNINLGKFIISLVLVALFPMLLSALQLLNCCY
jgi:hypothetical protein